MKCDVCGTQKDLRKCGLMSTEDIHFCKKCIMVWYNSGEVMREGILRERLRVVEGRGL